MWEYFPQIYSTLARDKSIIPAFLLSHLVQYIISVLYILLNKPENIPHFKRVGLGREEGGHCHFLRMRQNPM